MRTGTKLAAFAVVLAAAFGGSAAVGSAVGPIDVGPGSTGADDDVHEVEHQPEQEPAPEPPHEHGTTTAVER